MDPRSVGIVEKRFVTFAEPPGEMPLESGASLGPITLAYETYGRLNDANPTRSWSATPFREARTPPDIIRRPRRSPAGGTT